MEASLDEDAARQLGLEKFRKAVDAWRNSVTPVVDFERRAVDALYAMRDALTAVNRVQNMLLNSEVRAHLKEIGHDADACNSYLTDVKRSFDNTRKAYKKTFFGDAS